MKKYFILALCSFLSLGLITGCGSKKKDNKNKEKKEEPKMMEGSNQIETCPDCLFAYYKDEDGEYELTNDYETIKTEDGNQLRRFLGFHFDEDGKILNRYACGIYNEQAFCLEGSSDGSLFDKNVLILKNVFGEDKCETVGEYYRCRDTYTISDIEYSILAGIYNNPENESNGRVYVGDDNICAADGASVKCQ